jgi:hypothetical protein
MLRLTAHISLEKILSQHREILNAIKQQDSEKAEQAMKIHLADCDIETAILKEQYSKYLKQDDYPVKSGNASPLNHSLARSPST